MKDLLRDAVHEIRDLRRRNELLQAQVDVMELFGLTLRTTPNYSSTGASPDVAWMLDKEIRKIEEAEASVPKPAWPSPLPQAPKAI